VSEMFECSTLHKSNDRSHDRIQPILHTRAKIVPTTESENDVFRNDGDSLAMKIQNQQNQLQMSKSQETLRAGLSPLSTKIVNTRLS